MWTLYVSDLKIQAHPASTEARVCVNDEEEKQEDHLTLAISLRMSMIFEVSRYFIEGHYDGGDDEKDAICEIQEHEIDDRLNKVIN